MPALGQEFRTRPLSSLSRYNNIVTVFPAILWLWLTLSWVDYITNMNWQRRLHEFLWTTRPDNGDMRS